MMLLRGVRNRFGPPVLLPLQLSDDSRGVRGFKSTPRETKPFTNKLELGREHVLLLDELLQDVMVLTEARDVGDDAEVVGRVRGVAQFLEVSGPTDEHMVEPGR